jgi:hypothetical protein
MAERLAFASPEIVEIEIDCPTPQQLTLMEGI